MYSALRFIPKMFLKGRLPVHLTFFITNLCNSRCEYCFYHENNEPLDILKAHEVEKIAKSFKGNLLWLLLSGGEPFLNPDIDKICYYFYKYNKPTFITIPTNGLLPEVIEGKVKKIAEKCPKSVITIKLSLDGWEEDHDSLRGVKGNFKKAMKTLKAIGELKGKYKNIDIGVNSVLLPQNEDKIIDLYRKVKTLRYVDSYTFSLARGIKIGDKYREVDAEKFRKFSQILLEDALKKEAGFYSFGLARQKLAIDLSLRKINYRVLKTGRQQIPCYAGRLNLVLTETGDVFPCELLPLKLGNVRESGYDIGKILSSDKTKACLEKIRAGTNTCDNCTHECYMITNILFNPKQLMSSLLLSAKI